MDKRYKALIIIAVICCVLTVSSAAASLAPSGVLLYAAPDDSATKFEYQTDTGVYVSGSFDSEPPAETTQPQVTPEYTVNINTASAFELAALLPGIGEKKAAAIVEYRELTGGFRSVEELVEVDGISRNLYEKIKAYCVIEDE